MTDLDDRLAGARGVADAVLYEGYVLYPYRASAGKNQLRWMFGLLAPREHLQTEPGEASTMRTELVLESRGPATVHARVRYLHVQSRTVSGPDGPVASAEVDGEVWTTFEEALEQTVDLDVGLGATGRVAFDSPAGREEESLGRGTWLVRERNALAGVVSATVDPVDGPFGLWRLTVDVTNVTPWAGSGVTRAELCRHSLAAVHTLLAVDGGRFISSVDPPEYAQAAVHACRSAGTFPVLIRDDVVLSSPITLYDRPVIAPESEGDMFDATEIDEILALRVLTLTDEEKREARATDPRAAAVIDRCDAMGPEAFASLHGTFRSMQNPGRSTQNLGLTPGREEAAPKDLPWWEPSVDEAFDPWTDTLSLGGERVGKGSRVVLRPSRRSDAQDLFVAGKPATVAGVFHDVDDDVYLAVTIDDDPGAELHQWHGRYLYFLPDEVEVVQP